MTRTGLRALVVAMTSAILIAGCAQSTKQAEPEPVTMNQRTMQAYYEQLKATHEARAQLLRELEDTELAQRLWDVQRGNYLTMVRQWHYQGFGLSYFEYTQPELLHLHDYDDMAEMTEAYLASLRAVNSDDYMQCSGHPGGQGFDLNQGFEFPFRYSLSYHHMTLDNGDVWDIPAPSHRQKQSDPIIHQGDLYCYQQPLSPDDPQPVSVAAEFRGQLPDDLLEFEFTAADVGKTVEKGGYMVTLQEFEQDYYTVEIEAAEGESLNFYSEDLLAEAVDQHGEYIAYSSTERQPPIREQKLDELLEDLIARATQGTLDQATADEELQALREKMLAEQEGKLYLSRGFHGVIDKAVFTLLVYKDDNQSFVRELQLPVHNFANLPTALDAALEERLRALPEIPVTAPVYDGRAELRTPLVDLDAAQMQARIEILQALRQSPPAGSPQTNYPAEVVWFSPPVQSDIFFSRRQRSGTFVLARVDFFDKDDKLVKDPTLGGDPRLKDYENDIFGFEVRPGLEESPFMVGGLYYRPDIFPRQPARLKGSLPIAVALNPIKDSYTADELPPGMTLEGNRLIVDYAIFEPREMAQVTDESGERRNLIFVRDSQGYLVEITRQTWYHSQPGRVAVDIYYFYGEPESVEVWYPGEQEYVDYEFDIQLINEDVKRDE